MAGKGGGAWKVAYADFVTAMMAFFLVMWICVQDQKLKESVAHYFMNPMGGTPIGASSKPSKSGALFNAPSHGDVPKADSVAMGRGRNSYTGRNEANIVTKLVGDFLEGDEKAKTHWRDRAKAARDVASRSKEVRENGASIDEVAAKLLAAQMKDEFARDVPVKADGIHKDLLSIALGEVNWAELAEDLLNNLD